MNAPRLLVKMERIAQTVLIVSSVLVWLVGRVCYVKQTSMNVLLLLVKTMRLA
jgi:hypothetical protein